jgi:AcrR family transcriptional regulator
MVSMARVRSAAAGRARALVQEDSRGPGDEPSSAEGALGGSGQARQRILDAAEDLFAADGFDAARLVRG